MHPHPVDGRRGPGRQRAGAVETRPAAGRGGTRGSRHHSVERVVRVDVRVHDRARRRRGLDRERPATRERGEVAVAAGPPGSCRAPNGVARIARVQDVAGDEGAGHPGSLVGRGQGHHPDGHPVLVHPDERQRPGHDRARARPGRRRADRAPRSASPHRRHTTAPCGPAGSGPAPGERHRCSARARLPTPCSELDDPVDLLERVREEQIDERQLRAVGHAPDLLDEVREDRLRRLEVRREHGLERHRAQPVTRRVAGVECQRPGHGVRCGPADDPAALERGAAGDDELHVSRFPGPRPPGRSRSRRRSRSRPRPARPNRSRSSPGSGPVRRRPRPGGSASRRRRPGRSVELGAGLDGERELHPVAPRQAGRRGPGLVRGPVARIDSSSQSR